MREKVLGFIKKDPVLLVAVICAVVSIIIGDKSPSKLIGFIDWHTLALLTSLMLVTEGFKDNSVFDRVANKITKASSSRFVTALVLVFLPFFSAMLITNDVALITFVPLAISVLKPGDDIKAQKFLIAVVVLQTMAANLGAMITPVGNPHNLFVYIKFKPTISEFLHATLPFLPLGVITLFVGIVVFSKIFKADSNTSGKREKVFESFSKKAKIANVIYVILAALCIGTVLNLIDYKITFVVIVITMLIVNMRLLVKIDLGLLMTFVCFFIFSGNIRNIDAVRELIERFTGEHTFWTGIIATQIINNVPSTLLLAPFTTNWSALMVATAMGGVGTLIASMANLISLKIYMKSENSRTGLYVAIYSVTGIIYLAAYCIFSGLIGFY